MAPLPRTIEIGDRTITRIGLGTNRLRDDERDRSFIRGAADAGLELIDTAHSYTDGESESSIGAALEGLAERPLVATKGGYSSNEPDELRSQLEESFERLRIDAIDLYYVHRVDPEIPLAETIELLGGYVKQGRIAHIGLSEVTVEQIAEARETQPIAAVQNEYSLGARKHDEVIDYCEREGIVFVPFFPLRGESEAVRRVATRHGASETQVQLAWLLRRSPAVAPIPGTRSGQHLRENLAALDLELGGDDLDELGA